MKKNIARIFFFVCLLTFCSCESWIEVKPYDKMAEEDLFKTREGFEKALNGVYIEMVDRSVYGRELTARMVDIMAQYYRTTSTNNDVQQTYDFIYDTTYGFKEKLADAWEKLYNLIANVNIIIDNCDKNRDALSDHWYGIIKGEALALRAFLHFDVMRLWGPVYFVDPDGAYVPYSDRPTVAVTPLTPTRVYMQKVIDDLTTAMGLLEKDDPIFEYGRALGQEINGSASLTYRQYRMNYFAVKALLARAYLWIGDKPNAFQTSTEVIDECDETGIFRFVTNASATNTTSADRVFSPEVFFSLCDQNRQKEIFEPLFDPNMSDPNRNVLVFAYNNGAALWSGKIQLTYPDQNDIRFKQWATLTNAEGTVVHYNRKYADVLNQSNVIKFVPLVRMSEMYLIAAETATDPTTTGVEYFNILRDARAMTSATAADENEMRELLEWEYRREFLSEGQTYFYYKRIGSPTMPNPTSTTNATKSVSYSQYVAPLPDQEQSERRTSEE